MNLNENTEVEEGEEEEEIEQGEEEDDFNYVPGLIIK